MQRGPVRHRTLRTLLVTGALLQLLPNAADAGQYDGAIERASQLLPRPPEKVVVVERPSGPDQHQGKPHAEAFVIRGEPTVYLVREAATLRSALKGPGIFDFALAAIIWHEMAHIDGADEAAAQRAEEQLWREFILTGRVDRTRGMQYLALLRQRR